MIDTISALATACFAFACGIFLTLSYIESPVRAVMGNPMTRTVPDEKARTIHATLNRLIRLLPPTMMTTMGTGTILLVAQAWQLDFAWEPLTVLIVLLLCLGYMLSRLFGRIEAVKDYPSDGDIEIVREGLGKLAALHHVGLVSSALTLLLQVTLVCA
ncbi:hypothetical protein FF098_004710 [Parvularcula flava]|uniref:Uncharacterized protein n=1 Tax=Aquisalinus luteolus TaxID=1566827 RepID=A0A8J3EQA9_9PROT|nr:hypothetical protein [Aquisalinus luteolus]NHK27201.1 hypothetical protein [Aquisalinus luteolus]GGH94714.1 hypothetical protein GCM10011355_09550 [Aquisalinus luteolus]